MKVFTLCCCLFVSSFLIAQTQSYDIPLGQDTKVNIDSRSVYQLDYGHLEGDFSQIQGPNYVQIKDGTLIIHDVDREICYITNPIDVSNTQAFRFTMSFSGEGTLDDERGGWLQDWINIYYVLDNVATKLGEEKYTMTGVPNTKVQPNWVELEDEQELKLKVCMRMTGADEYYTLHQIQLEEQPKVKNLENTDAKIQVPQAEEEEEKEEELNSHIQFSQLELSVYPNPTTDWLNILDPEQFDLTKIEITNQQGQLVLKTNNYPIDVKGLTAGEYFITVNSNDKSSTATQSFIVIR